MTNRETNPYQPGRSPVQRWRATWLCGAAGFGVAFFGLLLAQGVHVAAPGRAGVMRVPLWRFYARELSRRWDSSGVPTGPVSNSPGLWQSLLEHLLFAAAGGAICVGVAWAVRRLLTRRTGPGPAAANVLP